LKKRIETLLVNRKQQLMTFRNRTPNTKKSILLLQHIAYNVSVHHFVFSKCDVFVITWLAYDFASS